jgi:Mrp family chromosome partitioning ATPase
MSEYLRVLTRHERETRRTAPSSAAVRTAPAAKAKGVPALVPAVEERTRRTVLEPVPDNRAAAYAALYDNLRATANGDATRSLVIAGADGNDPAAAVIDGLAAHVRRLGHRVCIAEVMESDGLPLLRVRPEPGDPGRVPASTRPLDLRSHASADDVRGWLASVADVDLTLIDGGALAASIDPALLACGCDGLLIVLRAEATGRDALRVAAERARAVNCRTLGIVLEVQTDRIPPWQRNRSSRSRSS